MIDPVDEAHARIAAALVWLEQVEDGTALRSFTPAEAIAAAAVLLRQAQAWLQ